MIGIIDILRVEQRGHTGSATSGDVNNRRAPRRPLDVRTRRWRRAFTHDAGKL
jgi:hypothetical protein